MKYSALASIETAGSEVRARHLRPVDAERKGAKFAALDHDVARVLGPQRGAAVLYGFLASTWFEYADPQKLAERKRKISPGDWVEVNYTQFMEISGTNAKASIIRWLRILAEDTHACPWGRCADEHPLIVVHRQGQSRPNRYRKWRCGEDVLVIRPRVRSQKLSEAARRRVDVGQRLNGITDLPPAPIVAIATPPHAQLDLLKSRDEPSEPEVLLRDFNPLSLQDHQKSHQKTSESLATELLEVSPTNRQQSYDETSLREKTLNTDSVGLITPKAAANVGAAAIEESTEVDAVACEVVDAVVSLAQRIEPEYPEHRAWMVARRLATAALDVAAGEAAAAREILLRAIGDRRLGRASNPIGLLIRGVIGDDDGADRFLLAGRNVSTPTNQTIGSAAAPELYQTSTGLPPGLHDALLEALRAKRAINDAWLREREIPPRALAIARAEVAAETKDAKSGTPRATKLAAEDASGYQARLETILSHLELPAILQVERRLDHPMLHAMCLNRLEADLECEAQSDD